MIKAAVHTVDMFSDVLFIIDITYQPDFESSQVLQMMAIASIIFIVIPVGMTLWQLYRQIQKWQKNDGVSDWITNNVTLLYVLSILT